MTAITAPELVPQRGMSREEFDFAGDYWVRWQAYVLVPGLQEFITQLNNFATSAESATELTIGLGTKSLTADTGKGFLLGMTIKLAAADNPTNWMQGDTLSYDVNTGALQVSIKQRQGSGTYSSWVISSATSMESLGMGADIASSATPDIWQNDGNKRHITGTAELTGFAAAGYGGQAQWLRFDDAVKITAGANLILGRASYTTTAGDWALVIAETTTKFRVFLFRVDGKAAVTLITGADIPAGTITRSHLSSGVARKVANFGRYSASDYIYPSMVVQLDNTSLIGWGLASGPVLGINTSENTGVPAAVKPVFSPAIPAGETIVKWARCGAAMFAVLSNKWVYSTGSNGYGVLGHGDTTTRLVMKRIEYFFTNSINVVDVTCESSRITYDAATAFFLTDIGEVYSVGHNNGGNLGLGDTANRSTPSKVSSISGVKEIIQAPAYYGHTFFLKTDGTALSAGYNAQGQLGVGDTVNKTAFTAVPGFSGNPIKKIRTTFGYSNSTPSSYAGSSILLTESGDVYVTGYNGYGQLGLGDTANRSSFTKIASLANIVDVGCAGGYYGYMWALSASGRLYIWGYNAAGVCGDGTTTNRTSPYNVVQYQTVDGTTAITVSSDPPFVGLNGTDRKIAKIVNCAAGLGYGLMVVLDTDGRIWVAGSDYTYGTGLGGGARTRFTQILPPSLSAAGEKLVDVALIGYDQYMGLFAISDQKHLYGCGYNGYCFASGVYSAVSYVYSMQRIPL